MVYGCRLTALDCLVCTSEWRSFLYLYTCIFASTDPYSHQYASGHGILSIYTHTYVWISSISQLIGNPSTSSPLRQALTRHGLQALASMQRSGDMGRHKAVCWFCPETWAHLKYGACWLIVGGQKPTISYGSI